jgi:hypothetical protein
MRAATGNALKDRFVAITVVVASLGTFRALLSVLALKCLMANLLAIVALCRPWSIFKGAGYARFSSGVEEPVGQEPPSVSASG